MEYRDQAEELRLSGPPMASYHYILDVEIVAELAGVLGKTMDAVAYQDKAASLRQLYNTVYLRRGPTVPDTCGYQNETGHHSKGGGGVPVTLSCAGGTITNITFASFGTPTGDCRTGFRLGSCDASSSRGVVTELCLGESSCAVTPNAAQFGGIDPCVGVPKHLAVQVNCSAGPGTYATYGAGQTINAVPLSFGLVPSNLTQSIVDTLVAKIMNAGNHSTVGFIGAKYLYPVLAEHGRAALAVDLALKTSLPSYGYQVINGATTLWESWSGAPGPSDPAQPSHNHHFLGGIGQWLVQGLAGIKNTGTNWDTIEISPDVTDHEALPSAASFLKTPHGVVSCSWQAVGSEFYINASVPVGASATIDITMATSATVGTVWESGVAVWQSGRFFPGHPGVVSAAPAANGRRTRFHVVAGEYFFQSS